jgi:catechol 2,3-dioxygenase-like lactoylglutathione lyase family enzyme
MRLAHATLLVSDIPRSKRFYSDLGFRLLVDDVHYARFQVGDTPTTLSIHAHPGPISPAAEIGILFDSPADLDHFAATLPDAPVPVDQPWLWREVRVTDPDGHRLLFVFAGENHLDPPWRVRP